MNPIDQYYQTITRRHFFRKGAMGLGGAALASLLPKSPLVGRADPGLHRRRRGAGIKAESPSVEAETNMGHGGPGRSKPGRSGQELATEY